MMKSINVYILIFFILGVIGACVSPYEFDADEQSFTVISGVVTNSWGERTITVKRTRGLDTTGEPIESSGAIFKNGELEAELVPLSQGELVVPVNFQVESGAAYHIEILANDKVYKSSPITVPEKIQTDSLSYRFEERLVGFSRLGAPLMQWFIDIYAYVDVQNQEKGNQYYKWQVDEAWAVASAAGVCYVIEPVTENPAVIADSRSLVQGPVAVKVASAELGQTFLQKHYFNTYLHTLDRNTMELYQKMQRLSEGTGTLFDEVPAPFKGNIFVSEGEKEDVLGIIEFSVVDTLRLAIDRSDIEIRLYDQCGSPFPCPGNGGPCICENCIAIYGIASTNKPFYWE